MAVTIQTTPDKLLPVGNPIEYTFSSTESGQPNFSFYVELEINGAPHSYHQVFPESQVYGRFNLSEILKSYVQSEILLPNTSNDLQVNSSFYAVRYSISVKEKYGDPPEEQGSYTTTSDQYAINGSLRYTDWINYDWRKYNHDTNSNVDGQQVLSFYPTNRSRMCGMNESLFLGFFVSDSSAILKVQTKDVAGNVLKTEDLTLSIPFNDWVIAEIDPQNIIDNSAFTTSDFNDAYLYEVTHIPTGLGGNLFVGDNTETIIIDRECGLYDGQRLHWINKFGVYESFTFQLYSEENTTIKSSRYQKSTGEWDGTTRKYTRQHGERTAVMKTAKDKLTLNSDWIHQDIQQWLSRSLYESPQVYLEVSYNVFEHVIVTKSRYKQKQRIREGLIQENVEVDRTYEYKSQLN